MSELLAAHKTMILRYRTIVVHTSEPIVDEFLLQFCDEALKLTNPDKLSRWVGFIQGVMFERGWVNTKRERDFSRGLYKPIYEKLGYDTTTVDVESKTV